MIALSVEPAAADRLQQEHFSKSLFYNLVLL
jgi:hypothetical protein